MVPVTVPLLSDERFTCQGRAVAVSGSTTVSGSRTFSGLVQLVKVTAEIEPAPEPDSPLPLFSAAVMLTDVQENTEPVPVSLKVALPDMAMTLPPGLMVQVAAATAAAGPGAAPRAAMPP